MTDPITSLSHPIAMRQSRQVRIRPHNDWPDYAVIELTPYTGDVGAPLGEPIREHLCKWADVRHAIRTFL